MSSAGGRRATTGGEIVTIQCGAAANWIGTQYHLLQNSNCDVNSAFARSSHFRRSESLASASSRAIVGERDASIWQPRVVCLDASVGLDGILATFKQEKGEGDHQEEFIATQSAMHRQAQREEAKQAAASASASSSKKAANANRRPQHWADLAKGVMPFHPKSSYSVPGLYEGTSDFHLHEQGKEIMEREAIHEEVVDRTRWFLEECDQPDGLHLIVEANTGWSGVGSTLLGLLRDEYERIPIFCISALTPPPPHSVLGQSFASSTTTLQSILNSGLLLSAASQLATAYLPLTTDYFGNTAPMSKLALPDAYAAIQRGEVYESATLLAWVMHLATAEYRLQPRTTNMAMTLAGLTQQTSANVLSVKMMTQLQPPAKDEEQTSRSQHRHASHSSSHQSSTPVVHTSSSAVPLSFLGHDVGFRVRADTPQPEEDERGREGARKECDVNQGLTESLHVFGRTEEMSHQQLIQTMEKQPTAMFRRVYGTSRVNLPPSFPLSYYDLLNEGHILSVSRCSTLGREIGQFGSWLTHLNRGGVTASHYTASSTEQELARVPLLLAHLQTERARNQSEQLDEDGDRTRGHVSEQLQMAQWSQQELDEFVECGTTLQNLSELY